MNCHEMQRDLEAFVLGALPPAAQAEAEAHLAQCQACREAEAECRLLMAHVRLGAEREAPRAEFAQAVMATVSAEMRAQRHSRRRRRVAAAAGVAAMVLVGLGVWSRWSGSGGARPGASIGQWSAEAATARVAAERWSYASASAAPASVAERVVVRGTTMYLLRDDEGDGSRVVAIDIATGAPRWRSECHTRGYLAADDQRVYCLAAGGPRHVELVALGATDGATLWRRQGASPHRLAGPCRPVPLGDDRVCWTAGNTLSVFDARDGRGVWSCSICDEGTLSAAVADGERVVAVTARAVHCLDGATGREVWRQGLGARGIACGRAQVACAGGRLFVAQGRVGQGVGLSCVDLDVRTVVWRRRVPGARSVVAVGDGVFVRGHQVVALDGRTGATRWQCAAEGCGPLTVVDGLLHYVDSARCGRLVALHPDTGRTAWQMRGVRSCDAFAKVGGTGYIKTNDGIVHALAFRTGGPS